ASMMPERRLKCDIMPYHLPTTLSLANYNIPQTMGVLLDMLWAKIVHYQRCFFPVNSGLPGRRAGEIPLRRWAGHFLFQKKNRLDVWT
ncbi:hypothetical protein, partial [Lacticaseibacillus hegangensis]